MSYFLFSLYFNSFRAGRRPANQPPATKNRRFSLCCHLALGCLNITILFFPYKAFYLKIKMNTENLVPDDYLIEIWGFKVCQYLPLGRNIGSCNFCSDNPPNTVLCSSVNIYVTTHVCWLVQLGWEKVWKIIRKYIQNSRTSSYVLGRWGKGVIGRNTTPAAREELSGGVLMDKII